MVAAATSLTDSPVAIQLRELILLRERVLPSLPQPARQLAAQQGGYLSRFRGRGMECAEVRAYVPGDDVRSVDWRVTARTGKMHTKLFHEERERPVLVALDYRRPMFFATRGRFKVVQASLLAALFAWQALERGDRIGGFIFSEERTLELRPQLGKKAVLQLLHTMVAEPAWQRTLHHPFAPQHRLSATLQRLQRVARPGSLILLLSDFNQWDEPVEKHLALVRRHCDLGLVHCYDALETELPPAGTYRLSDGERDLTIMTSDTAGRQSYRKKFEEKRELLENFSRRMRCRLFSLPTDADPLAALVEGFGAR